MITSLATDVPFIVVLLIHQVFRLHLGFVEFSLRILIVVLLSLIRLSLVGLFCKY